MSTAIAAETLRDETIYFVRHCPKCGCELEGNQEQCEECMYSDETALTPEEAREFTMAGD